MAVVHEPDGWFELPLPATLETSNQVSWQFPIDNGLAAVRECSQEWTL